MKKLRRMRLIIVLIVVVVSIIIYMLIPYSPVKMTYLNTVEKFTKEYQLSKHIIKEDDLEELPDVLQKYFIHNGYVGIESASAVIFDFKNADFSMGINKPNVKIDYLVYDYVMEPTRVAFIDSKMYGIPFQGIDICKDGKGSMKGIIAKHIKLFETDFVFIDSSYLAECLMHPSLALQDNITYKTIDDYSVEATIKKNDAETTGIFYFNENYEMIRFVADKRYCSDTNTYEKWSAITTDYKKINGVNVPTKFQAIWHYDSGDLIYFDSNGMEISYQ